METVLEKISSYNFLNCIIPGAILVFLSERFFEISLLVENQMLNLVLIYFVGMIASRVGSLLFESPIRKISRKIEKKYGEDAKNFIHFAPYQDFIEAEKEDPKLDVLSTTNNMYRTFVGMFICLFFEWLFFKICEVCPCVDNFRALIVCILLFLMFVFAYKKQTGYIVDRVKTVLEMKKKQEEKNT